MNVVLRLTEETWLICGGRRYADQWTFDCAMQDIVLMRGLPRRVIHGASPGGTPEAPGADQMADAWGKRLGLEVIPEKADWTLGRRGGPVRNQRMLDLYRPDAVIAFPGGDGTADMLRRAKVLRAKGAALEIVEIHEKAP